MTRKWLVPIAVAVALAQIGVLVFMISSRASILRTGQEILLEVEPFDPRDLLRGDYVILGYNISQIPTELFGTSVMDMRGHYQRPVHVRLRPDSDGVWQPVRASLDTAISEPASQGEVDIRGTAEAFWSDQNGEISVDYGIERFYVPEGEGIALENDMRVRPFRVKVAVGRDGTAQIKAFYDGETMLYSEPLY